MTVKTPIDYENATQAEAVMEDKPGTLPKNDSNFLSIDYHPRLWQKKLHTDLKRFSVVVLHRRAGKSVFAINHLLAAALRCKLPDPQYFFIAPTFSQAKRIAWKYLHTFTEKIPGVVFNESDLKLSLPHNNAQIMLLSGENYHSIRGIYSDGTVLDEFQDMSPMVWEEAVRPTLSDRTGWCLFAGTPRGNNHFKTIYDYAKEGGNKEWYHALYKATDTGIIPESELDSARATMDEATFNQEYMCSFSAGLLGAYFAKELDVAQEQNRITRVPHDSSQCVDTAWDLGISDTTAIWFFQTVRGAPRIIDCYETSGKGLDEIVLDLRAKPYNYGATMLPHDGNKRDLLTGKTFQQQLYKLGFRNIQIVPRTKSKQLSINAARMIIKQCVFDSEKCKLGLKALYAYRKKWNEKNNCFDDAPLHDWASNYSDAFQQMALGIRGDSEYYGENGERIPGYGRHQTEADTDYDPYSVGGA